MLEVASHLKMGRFTGILIQIHRCVPCRLLLEHRFIYLFYIPLCANESERRLSADKMKEEIKKRN